MNSQSVPFLDLSRHSRQNRRKVDEAMSRVLDRGLFILGPELEALEREFSEAFDIPHAAGVGSGTDALTLALEASGAITPGEGHEVITSALSAAFTPLAICRAGAVPRFVDVDPSTLQISASLVAQCIGEKTRAIIPVHLYGHAGGILQIIRQAREHRLTVIEDACQAHGSRLAGKALGTFADAAAFSFYPTKNLGALGDGGMVVSRDDELVRKVKMLRNGGQGRPYSHELLGYCSRLDELQAAILRLKLQTLEECNFIRRSVAEHYDEAFRDLDLAALPAVPDLVPNRHLYPIRTPRRDELRRFLQEQGIQTMVHYPVPLPFQPALQRFIIPGQEFPVAEKASREILSLPLYPELKGEEIHSVIRAVLRFFKA